jgi:hypothetical protein
MAAIVFWVDAQYSLVDFYRRFRGNHLHNHCRENLKPELYYEHLLPWNFGLSRCAFNMFHATCSVGVDCFCTVK